MDPRYRPITSRRRRRTAFTLVELLVVLGIIILLIGLLSPMIARSYRNAERARAASDMQAIAAALEAYKQDFAGYPQPGTTGTTYGSVVLGWALIAPGAAGTDGADGPGFRIRRGLGADGLVNTPDDEIYPKIYPPYLQPDRFKLSGTQILDRFRQPIFYYLALGNPNVRAAGGYVATSGKPMFLANQNDVAKLSLTAMRVYLGDVSNGTAGNTTPDGMINGSEAPRFVGPYILWSAGPDETYGPQAGETAPTGTLDAADADKCDDITNFKN